MANDKKQAAPGDRYGMEMLFPKNHNVQLRVDWPFKRTMKIVASELGISVNDLIRQAVKNYLENNYPGYSDLYVRILQEETRKGDEKDDR